ncbi:hypothetical protein ACLKA6_009160 [Drosophila palustris]
MTKRQNKPRKKKKTRAKWENIAIQDSILLEFMRNHPDMARNFTRGDRVAVSAAWADLAVQLNSELDSLKSFKFSFSFLLIMASAFSVLVAGLMHFFIRIVILNESAMKFDTPGSTLPSCIVCLALMDLIYDNRLVPLDLYGTPKWVKGMKLMFETAIAFLLLEVGNLLVWKSLELSLFIVVQTLLLGLGLVSLETYERHEALIIGAFTSSLALAILAMSSHATQRFNICSRYLFGEKPRISVQFDNMEQQFALNCNFRAVLPMPFPLLRERRRLHPPANGLTPESRFPVPDHNPGSSFTARVAT